MSDTPPAAAHLDAERLAALADEVPTAGEAAHLAACAACRREREAYVALVALARAEGAGDGAADVYVDADARAAGPPAAGAWDALAAVLRAEGLAGGRGADAPAAGVDGAPRWAAARGAARGPAAWARRSPVRLPARLAAGLLLVAGAAAAGRLSATRGPLAVVPNGMPNDGPGAAGAFASSEEARATLARARRDYAQAAAFLAAADPAAPGEDATLAAVDGGVGDQAAADRGARTVADAELLRERLATIDALLPRVRAAARQAPEDPAVNQLYLSAYDARETALRQLGRTLPAGVQLTGY